MIEIYDVSTKILAFACDMEVIINFTELKDIGVNDAIARIAMAIVEPYFRFKFQEHSVKLRYNLIDDKYLVEVSRGEDFPYAELPITGITEDSELKKVSLRCYYSIKHLNEIREFADLGKLRKSHCYTLYSNVYAEGFYLEIDFDYRESELVRSINSEHYKACNFNAANLEEYGKKLMSTENLRELPGVIW